jgi:hypothetical protein
LILVLAGATVTAILEIGLINVSYAQVTPGQNPIYNPSDTHIDGTESRTCGVPKTPSLSSANTNNDSRSNDTYNHRIAKTNITFITITTINNTTFRKYNYNYTTGSYTWIITITPLCHLFLLSNNKLGYKSKKAANLGCILLHYL